MAISITEQGAKRISDFLANRGSGIGVRLGVKTTGCSGMAYVIEFVDEINTDEDVTFDSNGVTIVVDKKSLVYIDGTEMDYVKEGLNEGFEFKNPNEKDACGCGECFTV